MSCLTRRLALTSFSLLLLGSATHLNAQVATLSTTSVSFGAQVIGTTSSKTVRLTNTGSAPLVITNITAPSAPFLETNNCPLAPSSLAPSAHCTFSFTFAPTTTGSFSSSISITDNASGSPQIIHLSGNGVPQAVLSPLVFGLIGVGTTSPPKTATLQNNLNTALTITSITPSGDFAVSGTTCGASLAAFSKCQITVTFTPTQVGIRSGSLTVVDNANNSPQTAQLAGVGTLASLISISVTPANLTIPVGSTQQFTATGSFPDNILLNLTNLVYWSSSATSVATISNALGNQGLATAKAAGTTTILATSISKSGSTSLTVSAGGLITPTMTWPTPSRITYGTPLSATQLDATATAGGTSVPGTYTYTPPATTVLPAGSQTLSVLFTPTDTTHYTTATASVTLTVNKTAATVTANASGKVYGATDPTLGATETGFTAADAGTITLSATRAAGEVVGTYVITPTASGAATANYSITYKTALFTITQASATVTANAAGKVYGATEPTLSAAETGFTAADAGTITLSATRVAGENVGTYVITPTASGAAAANYSITYKTALFTITQASATVTANAAGKVYGATEPTLSAAETGFTAADAGTITLSATRVAGENVGTYVITPTASGAATANYSITYATANFSITQATPGFSNLSASQSITAGTSSITLSGTISAGAVFPPPNVETVSITINGSTVPATIGNNGSFSTNFLTSTIAASASPYTITYSYAGDGNFTSATNATTALTVNQPSVTLMSIVVTPTNSSIAVGGTLQFTATGKYSDSSTQNLTSSVAWTSSATNVASVNSTGLLTAAASGCGGSTVISATVGAATGSTVLTALVIGGSTCAGNLTVARDPHTSTLLPDGTVLVAGGISSSGTAVASAEIYTPSTNVSTQLMVSMTVARANHTATLLTNGKVLIVGGADGNGNPLASAEIYDPTAPNTSGGTGTFTATAGSPSTARLRHTATLLSDGTVLIAGGYTTTNLFPPTASAELYNPASGTFTQFTGTTRIDNSGVTTSRAGMTTPRGDHTATLLADGSGYVLIAGGVDNTGSPSNTFELYSPYCQCFFNVVDSTGTPLTMSDYRSKHTATLLDNGLVLLVGGADSFFGGTSFTSDLYNPATQTMTQAASPNTQRLSHTATLLTNGQVLITGGLTQNGAPFSVTGSMELYDPIAGTWSSAGALLTARYEQTATALDSGIIFINGGADSSGNPLSSFELYTPTSLLPSGLTGSITVAPTGLQIPVGSPQTFTATATINGVAVSPNNLTWSSSNTSVLTLTTDALGNAIGTPVSSASLPQQLTVQACFGSDTSSCGQAIVTVTSAVIVSIVVTPASQFISVPPGGSIAYSAQGTYTDGSILNVTSLVSWLSSDSTIATITAGGVATAPASGGTFGSTTISAQLAADNGVIVSATATLTVSSVISTGQLNTPRYSDSATLLTDGTVLFVGGGSPLTNLPLDQAELYNSGSGMFSAPLNLKTLSPVAGQIATLLNNGQVLLTGSGTPELYDPISQTFSYTGAMVYPRGSYTATLIKCSCANNGKVLVAGGSDSNGTFDNSAELYDPATGSFRLTGSMNTGRSVHTATMLNTGKVLVAGGVYTFSPYEALTTDSAELYDPGTETFAPTGSMADQPWPNYPSIVGMGRYQYHATLLNDGTVLMAGGFVNAVGGVPTIAVSFPPGYEELYDPITGSFSATAPPLYPRFEDTVTLLNDGTVLFAGGGGTGGPIVGFNVPNELYDPVAKWFVRTSNLQYLRYDNTATLLTNGNVLIAGGLINPSGAFPPAAELYRPTSLTPPGVTSITVTPASTTIMAGTSMNLTAIGNNGQQLASVTWSSSNTAFVTVTNDSTNRGTAYGVAAGTATIQACAGAVCGTANITVQ